MPSSATLLVLIVIALLVAAYLWRRRSSGAWGFVELVKNPGLWDRFAETRDAIAGRVAAAQDWDEDELNRAVRSYVLEGTGSLERRALVALGARTHASVLALLADPAMRARLVETEEGDGLPVAPVNRASELLEQEPPTDAIPLLVPFLGEPEDEIRKDAALVIASTGDATILPHLRTALHDEDEYVRSYALIGIGRARERGAFDEELRPGLCDLLEELLQAGHNGDQAAPLLLALDQARGVELLQSDAILRADGAVAHEALEALAAAGVHVPRARLLALIAALEQGSLEYPRQYTLGEALAALGAHAEPVDRPLLEALLEHADERVVSGASLGLLRAAGLEGFQERIWELEREHGHAALREPQRQFLAVSMCDAEVNNGGFAQYFVNSSGDHWQDAVAGLRAIGSERRLALLERALSVFDDDGPPVERRARQDALAAIYRADDQVFSPMEHAWYDSDEHLEALLHRFVIDHADEFR